MSQQDLVTEGAEGTPTVDSPEATSDATMGTPSADVDPGNYLERVKREPDFAAEEIRKKDRELTRQRESLKGYSSLDPYINALQGAEGVATALSQYSSALANPQLKQLIDGYLASGVLPTVSNGDMGDGRSDLYAETEPVSAEVQALQAEMQELRTRLSQSEGTIGRSAITGLLKEHRDAIGAEQFDSLILPQIEAQVSKWEQTPDGRRVLAGLNKDQMDTMIGKAALPHLMEIGEAARLRKLEQLKGASTGSVSTIATPGEGTPGTHSSVAEALAELKRTEGI